MNTAKIVVEMHGDPNKLIQAMKRVETQQSKMDQGFKKLAGLRINQQAK
ncbi:MAG: hypothetical protein JKX85_11925 [Phycisphaeraceae bacterium]|nr:hypothetical protein [Phycisphaeraceae bacterium]